MYYGVRSGMFHKYRSTQPRTLSRETAQPEKDQQRDEEEGRESFRSTQKAHSSGSGKRSKSIEYADHHRFKANLKQHKSSSTKKISKLSTFVKEDQNYLNDNRTMAALHIRIDVFTVRCRW